MSTSQFFGLMIGYSGLTAYQVAENTLANNVANVETEGYSRQYAERKATDALRTYTSYGMQGAGVTVTGIKQYRNEYFDNKYWANESDVGRYEIRETYMSRIEKYFVDTSTINGFSTLYNNFYNGLEELQKNPGQTSTRTAFLGNAQSLADYFRTMADNLKSEQESLNAEIKTTVERINTIAEEIASINKQINMIELRGAAANELRDKRALLVDELSKIVDVTTSEVPIVNESDNNKPTGANRFTIQISNGATLVSNYDFNTLEVVGRTPEQRYNQTDIDGLYDIKWKETNTSFSVLADNLSGSLKALFELRDGNNVENLKGTYKSGEVDANTGGNITMTVKDPDIVKKSLEDIIASSNIPQQGTITIGGVKYTYEGWSVKKDTAASEPEFTFKNLKTAEGKPFDPTASSLHADVTTVKLSETVDYQGIPYYMTQMNQWVREFAYNFNKIERNGEDLNGDSTKDISFFQYYNKVNGKKMDLDEKSGYPQSFNTGSGNQDDPANPDKGNLDNYYFLQAENFYVNEEVIKDTRKMATTTKMGDENVSDSDLVEKLIEIKDNKSIMEFRGCTSAEFLTCILSDISLNSMSAKTFKGNSTNIKNAIQNQRDSVSSVDDDEEALDLVKFQNAYNLNAKVIQTMTEIYDRLILQTGV